MHWHEHIRVDPQIQGGRPVITGTRVPVQIVVGSLAGGMTVEGVCEQYRLTEQQVQAALAYAPAPAAYGAGKEPGE